MSAYTQLSLLFLAFCWAVSVLSQASQQEPEDGDAPAPEELALTTLPYTTTTAQPHAPIYEATFSVTYNTTSLKEVSNDCGAYYARTFLENFIKAQHHLQQRCDRANDPDLAGHIRVNISVVARVRMLRFLVELHTYINISSSGTRPESRKAINTCSHVLEDALENATDIEEIGHNISVTFIAGNPAENCTDVVMYPQVFAFKSGDWICPENLTFDESVWGCVPGIAEDPTDMPALTSPVVMTTDSFNPAVDFTDTVSKTTPIEGMDPLSSAATRTVVYNNSVTSANTLADYSPTSPPLLNSTLTEPSTNTTDILVTVGDSSSLNTTHARDASVYSNATAQPSTESILSTTKPDGAINGDSSAIDGVVTLLPTDTWSFQIHNQASEIKLAEGDNEAYIDFSIWVNKSALCRDFNDSVCRVILDVGFQSITANTPICRKDGQKIPQMVIGRPQWGTPSDSAPFNQIEIPDDMQTERFNRIPIKAKLDGKYDGPQKQLFSLSLQRFTNGNSSLQVETLYTVPIDIEDRDRKATCQSINDPHITTFDGLEYNNYFEGEFILYNHISLPFRVHAIYQKCAENVLASCNCAIAVQTGDDVIVIDRCRRHRKPFKRLKGQVKELHRMSVDAFVNDDLTMETRIFQDGDGKKYFIYLPHGTYIKVMVSESLVNVWVVASPSDLHKTEGLCGTFDGDWRNDAQLRNGTALQDASIQTKRSRGQPQAFILNWRVEKDEHSIFRGVSRAPSPYKPSKYCECDQELGRNHCGFAMDVETCDSFQGTEVTKWMISRAQPVRPQHTRHTRSADNEYSVLDADTDNEPIIIDKKFVPPKYKYHPGWNDVLAKKYCEDYIKDDYYPGKLCSEIPGVNFEQEVTTCIEDIQITGNTSWAGSAREAMKEQCLEEIKRNTSLAENLTYRIKTNICLNDCSGRGTCAKDKTRVVGHCQCQAGYSGADCSALTQEPPYSSEIRNRGLCDIRYMKCDRVMVYGENFINGPNLTCHLQRCQMTETACEAMSLPAVEVGGLFINFNAVECPIPEIKSYLVSVSNNGVDQSDPLLFIPFDSACHSCSTNDTRCIKRVNSCIIDGRCYKEGDTSPQNNCLICSPAQQQQGLEWSTVDDTRCKPPWFNIKLPDWVIAVVAAVGGSLIGVLVGFLLYKCCCKGRKKRVDNHDLGLGSRDETDTSPFEDAMLHRNRGLPAFASNRFTDLDLQQPEYEETYFYNDGRGVENGVDSSTYF